MTQVRYRPQHDLAQHISRSRLTICDEFYRFCDVDYRLLYSIIVLRIEVMSRTVLPALPPCARR
jgi:hypothetical protein